MPNHHTLYFAELRNLQNIQNTYIKVGGLGEIRYRSTVLRLTFGFDYTPASNREGYRNALNGVMWLNKFAGRDNRKWVMGKTASLIFGLS